MEEDQVSSVEEPQAVSAASSDSFSQLWSDVMGMLVSLGVGGGVSQEGNLRKDLQPKGLNLLELIVFVALACALMPSASYSSQQELLDKFSSHSW